LAFEVLSRLGKKQRPHSYLSLSPYQASFPFLFQIVQHKKAEEMEQAAPNSGMSIFFELAAKTVMDMVRFMNRPPQGITSAGPSSPISKKRRSGRRTFLQRILRTARRYAVEYVRVPTATNIISLIKVHFIFI
jgi:hypothetical protein